MSDGLCSHCLATKPKPSTLYSYKMYARHPKTGALIRVLNSEGHVWKDSKTLVWLDDSASASTMNWSRWDIGASSLKAWTALHTKGVKPDICILLGPISETREWLIQGLWESCRIVLAPKALLEDIGVEGLAKLRITNMVCIEECIHLYPFLEQPWLSDDTDADVEAEHDARVLTALILQYGRTFPVDRTRYDFPAAKMGLRTSPTLETPVPLIFLTQYYEPVKTKRAKELASCLKKNVACPYIDRIVLLNEVEYKLPVESAKVSQEIVGGRLRFSTVIRWIYEKAPADALIVIANSDIYLDDSWRLLWSVQMKDKFFSLLRWDEQEDSAEAPKLFGPRADSQDTWVVSAASVKERKWDWAALDFPFGKGGCDNAFNVEMLRQKFLIVNPCMNLITHHVHMSGIRGYDPLDIVEKPIYMHIQPSGIHDLNPVRVLGKPEVSYQIPATPLVIRGPHTDSQRATFLKMSKATDTAATVLALHAFENVFQTHTGMLHSYDSIFVGKSKAAETAWSKTELAVTSPCVEVAVALVAPYPDGMSPTEYLLNYMGKVFVLRDLSGAANGEWLGTDEPHIREALELFSWTQEEIPVIRRNANFKAWCRKAYTWIPQDLPITSYEVDALRKSLRGWSPTPSEKRRIVCVSDENWFTENAIDTVERRLEPTVEVSCIYKGTSISAAAQLLKGAWGVLVLGAAKGAWGLSWILPVGARVWEVQPESSPSVELYQLCTAAKLAHQLCIVPRVIPMPKDRDDMIQNVCDAILADVVGTAAYTVKPRILMPKSTGFFSHAGDSFREIVELWAEKGFVTVTEVVGLSHVWLGAVGDTLLYDRPTLDWLYAAKQPELKWKKSLFGNPTPVSNGKAWSFWPRRPRLVELLVEQGVGSASAAERTRGIVFYGRSENKVQMGHRTAAPWATGFGATDEFIHVEGEKPYPFSQRDYLKRLAGARWGLCLAGYGFKCHREIECMAMGCVPVVGPEVDITGYAVPPVEGIHFLRVRGPEEIQGALAAAEPKWNKMSAACRSWYQENASAEGMWNLTQRLVAN